MQQIQKWLKPTAHKLLAATIVVLLLAAPWLPELTPWLQDRQFKIAQASGLLPKTSPAMASKIKLDAKTQTYKFNEGYQSDPANQVGRGGPLITASLPKDASKGITTTDPISKVDFTVTPQAKLGHARQDGNRIYYPLSNGDGWLVYSLQAGQVREDLLLMRSRSDTLRADYKLGLGDALAAKLQKDGSVGVYGSSLPISGNVSTGSAKDQELLTKMRQKAAKDTLLFTLPAPTIIGDKTGVKAHYELKGNILTLVASGLSKASYPLDIDPSVYVASAQGLMYGNNESNIDFDTTNNLLLKAQLSGATFASWSSTTSLPANLWNFGVAVSGGYIYVVGGAGTGAANVATVYWAQITPGTDTIGTWSTNSGYNLPVALRGLNLVAYNDFLYAIGGNSGSGAVNTVYQLHLAPSGEPTPPWTAMTNLPAAVQYTGAAAYENQLYVYGGQSAAGTTGSNAVYTAPILPDGNLGSWTTLAQTLPAAIFAHASVQYNGYLYAIGGNSGGTLRTTTYYAKIKSPGVISNWMTASKSFATARQSNGGSFATVWAGYLYVSGGCSAQTGGICTTSLSDLQETSINADGSLTTWTTLSPTDSGYGQGVVSFANTLYTIGGCTATTGGNCSTLAAGSSYGQIRLEGYISPKQTQTGTPNSTLPTVGTGTTNGGRMQSGVVINNGFIYNIGGCVTVGCAGNSGARMSKNTSFAAIAADGSLTAPTCTGTGFNLANANSVWCVDSGHTINGGGTTGGMGAGYATVYNNILYYVGGFDGRNWSNKIYYVGVNQATGALTASWTAAAGTIPSSMGNNFAFTRNGFLYNIGGCWNGTAGSAGCNNYSASVVKCTITASTGAIASGACVTTGQLQLATAMGTMAGAVAGSFIYLAGGASGSYTTSTTVFRAKIDNNNNIVRIDNGAATGGWQTTTASLTETRRRAFAAAVNGYLYVIGGHNGIANTTVSDTQIGKINTETGDITSFTVVSNAITARWDLRGAAANSTMYLLGGCNAGNPPGSCSTLNGNSEYLLAYNNYNGTPAGYTNTAPMANTTTTARVAANSVVNNGYIYYAGGCNATSCNSGSLVKEVSYAPINDDGTIATNSWVSTSPMLSNRAMFKLIAYNGYMYAMGGGATGFANGTTEHAVINVDGSLGTWVADTTLPGARTGIDGVIFNGYVYLTGGQGNGAVGYTNDIYYSQINTATGALGAWTTVTGASSFTGGRSNHTAIAYNSTLYIIGGYDGTNLLSDVQYTKLNSNGSIGTWSYTANLPQGLQLSGGFAANGYLYMIAGSTSATLGSTCSAATYVASIHANTTIASGNNPTGLGGWSQTSIVLGSARYGTATAYSQGKVYALGGACNGTMVPTGATQNYYSTIQSQPQVAKYSYYIDANNDVFPSKVLYNGIDNGTGASWQLQYRSAVDGATAWGQLSPSTTATLGTPQTYTALDGAGVDSNFARYYWLETTIDDTYAFGYPEDVSRGPTISDMTLQFVANPSKRLRHGKTFINNVQQPLDAPF